MGPARRGAPHRADVPLPQLRRGVRLRAPRRGSRGSRGPPSGRELRVGLRDDLAADQEDQRPARERLHLTATRLCPVQKIVNDCWISVIAIWPQQRVKPAGMLAKSVTNPAGTVTSLCAETASLGLQPIGFNNTHIGFSNR